MFYFSVTKNEFFLCCMKSFEKLKGVYLFHAMDIKSISNSIKLSVILKFKWKWVHT